ncbi:MAG: DUF3352 domain-containing protein [Synechococcales bacterium]|nr:DUF3352 domain-containing protein [Synechococcales bacterium]
MKPRSFSSLLIAAIAVPVVLGLVIFIWVTSHSPLNLLKGSPHPTPSATIFVPKDAPVVASLLVNPDRLVALRQAVIPSQQRRHAQDELTQLRQGLLAGIDYEHQIKPWLGEELTLAVTNLDLDRDQTTGAQPGYLMVLTTQDAQRSREFLQLFWQKRAVSPQNLILEQYKGTQLIYGKIQQATPQPSIAPMTLASAVVGDRYVLFANSPKVLKNSISNVQAVDLNLSSSATYQQAIAGLTQPRLGLIYSNLPQLAKLAGDASIQAQLLDLGQKPAVTYQAAAIGLGADRQGLVAETALIPPEPIGTSAEPPLSHPVEALHYIPANSTIVAAGIHLDQVSDQLRQTVKGYGKVTQLVDKAIQQWSDRAQVNLAKEIFNWVDGEYAVALLPQSGGSASNPSHQRSAKSNLRSQENALSTQHQDWVFIVDRSRHANIQTHIDQLDGLAKQQGLTLGMVQLRQQTVTAWTKLATQGKSADALQAQAIGAHTTVGSYEIFASSLETLDQVLAQTNMRIDQSKAFKAAIAPLQPNNHGYLYLDWKTAQPLLAAQVPGFRFVELVAGSWLEGLRSVTVSHYGTEAEVERGGVFLRWGT